jgi:hypothetical protein
MLSLSIVIITIGHVELFIMCMLVFQELYRHYFI